MKLKNTTYLSLRSNKLNHLPSNIGDKITNLVHLDLSENHLRHLPNSLDLLKKLKVLIISNNNLFIIPSAVCQLTNLRILKASNNQVSHVSSDISNLVNLELLDLSNNCFSKLPSQMENLNNLKYFYIQKTQLLKMPLCISRGMRSLETLNLSYNKSLDISDEPKSTNLKVFSARKNGLCPTFPGWIFSSVYINLEEVALDCTYFKHFHLLNYVSTSSIKNLSMMQCQLSDTILDKLVEVLENIENLSIGNSRSFVNRNSFWHFPIINLKNNEKLKKLNIQEANISILSPEISRFTNLKELNVSGNYISWLPDEVCNLLQLRSLNIDRNKISYLPPNIGNLYMLKELKASHNYLSRLPDSVKDLRSLRYIDLYGNEFHEFPGQIKHLNLLGLDIDQNLFPTDSFMMTDISYEKLRISLRDHWKNEDKLTGFRVKSNKDSESCQSDSSSLGSKSPTECVILENNKIMEDWDVSNDSANEFDPNEKIIPRSKNVLASIKRINQRRFCPADFHPVSTTRKIRQMRQTGNLKCQIKLVEGQFDDA
ncbi:leucine-rich repeat protein SHOC-2-like isoform X2 [Prorops nasuta]